MASEPQPITVEKAREFHRYVEHLLKVLNYMTVSRLFDPSERQET